MNGGMKESQFDEELQEEKISYLEDRITLEQEEKNVYRSLLDKALSGFESTEIGQLVRDLHTVSLELVDLKMDSEKLKVKMKFSENLFFL